MPYKIYPPTKYAPAKRARTGENRICPQCSKPFYLIPSRAARGEVHCSRACLSASAPRTEKICPVCLKPFTVPTSQADRYTVCSYACRLNRPRFTLEKCRVCSKPFKFYSVDRDRGNIRSHCSRRCYLLEGGETNIETAVRQALETLGIPFQREYRVGPRNIDFAFIDEHVALEIDGSYWHRDKSKDARRDKYLADHGFTVVRITETELSTDDPVALLSNRLMPTLKSRKDG